MFLVNLKGFEELYAADATSGRIWSYGGRNGAGHNGKFLSPSFDRDGYKRVCLRKDGKGYTRRVARLILESFEPASSEGMQVNHKNGDRGDDRLENLEWLTPSENIKHAFTCLGKNQSGANNNHFKVWGYEVDGVRTIVDNMTIDEWCVNNNIASTTLHTSMREKRELRKGRFKGYRFLNINDL